jgi:hypothetical protein
MMERSHIAPTRADQAEFNLTIPGLFRRNCARGGEAGMDGECAQCRDATLQRAARPPGHSRTLIPPIVHEVLRSSGQPLDPATRTSMEPRFGHDFGTVRVHTDAKAAESAQAVDALAYTVGPNIVFGAGQYGLGSAQKQRLLAHELAHVIQQRSFIAAGAEQGLERAADETVDRALSDRTIYAAPAAAGRSQIWRLQRKSMEMGPTVYMCAKDLETSPVGRHAFFRVGSQESGNPTYELEPQDNRPLASIAGIKYGSGCWQGIPMRNVPEDRDYFRIGDCEATPISLPCLDREFASYPIGRYCTFGPNSNTLVGHIARQCGLKNPDPPGWTPGIDDHPPESLTFAPSPTITLGGCDTEEQCLAIASGGSGGGSASQAEMPQEVAA